MNDIILSKIKEFNEEYISLKTKFFPKFKELNTTIFNKSIVKEVTAQQIKQDFLFDQLVLEILFEEKEAIIKSFEIESIKREKNYDTLINLLIESELQDIHISHIFIKDVGLYKELLKNNDNPIIKNKQIVLLSKKSILDENEILLFNQDRISFNNEKYEDFYFNIQKSEDSLLFEISKKYSIFLYSHCGHLYKFIK